MTSKFLPAPLVLPLGLLMVGCPGDDSSGSGDASATMTGATDPTDPTSATSTGPDDDDETTPPTMSDPTIDPSDTETTDPTETTTDPTETTGPPEGGTFFRFATMNVRDPHFYGDVILFNCTDVTDMAPAGAASVNEQFNEGLSVDTDADGFLDLNLMLLFRDDPIMQADGGSGTMDFANGQCAIPVENTVCDIRPGSMLETGTYTSMAAGTCHMADPAHLSSEGYTPAPGATMGPCFHSGPTDVTIVTTTFELPLEMAEIAAQYDGDPATQLISGTLRGFLSTANALATPLPMDLAMQVGADNVAGLLPGGEGNCATHDDTDGDGWWFYVDFTATPAPWNGP